MTVYLIKKYDKSPDKAVKDFFSDLLETLVDYIFIPGRSPHSLLPMPMLISRVERMNAMQIVPLAPVMPFNSARQASSLLKSDTGKKIAFLLKPCEKRALIELAKLSQCSLENAIIITADCLGRMENKDYLDLVKEYPDLTNTFIKDDRYKDLISPSCNVCTQFIDKESDIHVNIIGCNDSVSFSAQTEIGEKILEGFGETTSLPETGEKEKLLGQRKENLEALTQSVLSKTKEMDKFQNMLGTCLNCYNCRSACPVCYCKECVFLTDIFSHMPETLLNRADKRGIIKLPTDTTMFHMTRMAHMSHACVGCGQCTSVCPSDIPVADIFKVISKNTQDFFEYIPGQNTDEKIPYLNYKKEN
jgi:formate dehydrogenase subunit beta